MGADQDPVVQHLDADGPVVSTPADSSDLVGNAWAAGVDLIAIPVSRLHPDFFRLRSGLAGEVTQKLANYGVRLAVIGDVAPFEAASESFRAYVWEANRGEQVWFLPDDATLAARLAAAR